MTHNRRCVVRRTFDVDASRLSGGGFGGGGGSSGGFEVKALAMDEIGIVAGGRDGIVHGWRFTDDGINTDFF